MIIEKQFGLEKTTPGAGRYKELNDSGVMIDNPSDGSIGAVYIRKSALNGRQMPQNITVTIEVGD